MIAQQRLRRKKSEQHKLEDDGKHSKVSIQGYPLYDDPINSDYLLAEPKYSFDSTMFVCKHRTKWTCQILFFKQCGYCFQQFRFDDLSISKTIRLIMKPSIDQQESRCFHQIFLRNMSRRQKIKWAVKFLPTLISVVDRLLFTLQHSRSRQVCSQMNLRKYQRSTRKRSKEVKSMAQSNAIRTSGAPWLTTGLFIGTEASTQPKGIYLMIIRKQPTVRTYARAEIVWSRG